MHGTGNTRSVLNDFEVVVRGPEEIGATKFSHGAERGRRSGGLIRIFSPAIFNVSLVKRATVQRQAHHDMFVTDRHNSSEEKGAGYTSATVNAFGTVLLLCSSLLRSSCSGHQACAFYPQHRPPIVSWWALAFKYISSLQDGYYSNKCTTSTGVMTHRPSCFYFFPLIIRLQLRVPEFHTCVGLTADIRECSRSHCVNCSL